MVRASSRKPAGQNLVQTRNARRRYGHRDVHRLLRDSLIGDFYPHMFSNWNIPETGTGRVGAPYRVYKTERTGLSCPSAWAVGIHLKIGASAANIRCRDDAIATSS